MKEKELGMDKKTKVLIVDDEYTVCKYLKTYLEELSFDVIFTTNGERL